MRKIALLVILAMLLSLCVGCSSETAQPGTPSADGTPSTPVAKNGWVENEGVRSYYVNGAPLVGWQTVEGTTYYFSESGAMTTGWLEIGGKRYYLDENGSPLYGWQDIDGKRYYFTDSGSAHTGWFETEDERFYMNADGSMARGQVTIDGVNHFFTSTGAPILVVNPWNYVPDGYEPDLVDINDSYLAYEGQKVDRSCYDALIEMMTDCNKLSGARVYVVSSYRTMARQTQNYNRKVNYWKSQGYNEEDAKKKAATSVAIPGTSEHQLGLALDIIDTRSWSLDSKQETFSGQQWLMAHCWEYGFILRYPKDKIDITGIIYEPWHYRYVGKEVAAELKDSGLTLEEYIESLS